MRALEIGIAWINPKIKDGEIGSSSKSLAQAKAKASFNQTKMEVSCLPKNIKQDFQQGLQGWDIGLNI